MLSWGGESAITNAAPPLLPTRVERESKTNSSALGRQNWSTCSSTMFKARSSYVRRYPQTYLQHVRSQYCQVVASLAHVEPDDSHTKIQILALENR